MSRKSNKVRPRVEFDLPDGGKIRAQVRTDPEGESYYYATTKSVNGLKGDNPEELIQKCQERLKNL
ncbi:hypothetical protein [Sphingobacterium multivorum]|uniref:hypothetical protein n=1 Tax=Sphingobacterium multivorum TaxID=28454 RepID=UPI0031BA336A